MKVEITSITDNEINVKFTGFGEFDGGYGVEYQPQKLYDMGIHDNKLYHFTHLMPLVLGDHVVHFLVKKWEDGVITVFCHVTDVDGDKVAEATGRA